MTTKMFIDIIANDKTKSALTSVQTRLGNIKSSVFSLKGAFIGLGAGAVIKSFVDVGKATESLQVRFKFLFGSLEEGKVAFDNLTKFAARVPFSLDEISRASGNLAVVAKDAKDLNRVLEITGNVAAVTGLDFETTASQIQRAFSGGIGAADLFRERGVRALLGFEAGAKVTAEETIKRFEELFSGNGRFAKATTDLAGTLEGTLSMIGDKYFKFQKDVASGFFDELKSEFGDLDKFLADNEKEIKKIAIAIGENFAGAIQSTTKNLKAAAPTIKTIADALGTTITGFLTLPTYVQDVGIIGALLFGKKGAIAVGAISFLVGEIDKLFEKAKDISKLADIDFSKSTNIDELNLQMEVLEKRKNDIITSMRNEDSLIPLQTTIVELDETNAQIAEIQKRIDLLNSAESLSKVSVNTEHLSHNFKKLTEETKKLSKASISYYEITKLISNSMSDLTKKGMEDIKRIREEYNPLLAIKNEQAAEIQELNNAYNRKLLDFEEYQKLRKQIEEKYSKETAQTAFELLKKGRLSELEFEKLSQEEKKAILVGAGKDILGNMSKFNKQAFRLNQALALGDAIVSTAQGVAAGLKKGFPVGYIEAAITAARGAAQIAAIKSAPPPRALGGSVTAGQPYIVGEQGREMFVPNQSGTIVSNNDLNKGTVVNVSILANDTQGFDDLLVKRRSVIVNVINDALNSQGKEALI